MTSFLISQNAFYVFSRRAFSSNKWNLDHRNTKSFVDLAITAVFFKTKGSNQRSPRPFPIIGSLVRLHMNEFITEHQILTEIFSEIKKTRFI